MKRLTPTSAIFLALASSAAMVQAQDSSSMTGVVTDTTKAALPDTTVVLLNPHTGVRFTASTNGQGNYRFANVPPAPGYVVKFTHSGFADVSVTDVALQVGITRTQDATMEAGSTQAVEVNGGQDVVTINTTDASVGNNIDPKELVDLPIQNRQSVAVLFSLQPGVAGSSFTGARTDQSSVTIDGMDVNDIAAGSTFGGGTGTIVGNAPVDSVQEFRGVVAGLPTDVGTGSGGQFQLVTRSGTNQFHGDLNEYHRDTATSANAWFNNNARLVRPKLIRNQFGGALGGPIVRNKAYFFFDFNNSRIIQSANVERIVPLDSFRNGTVSYIRNNDAVSGTPCAATSRQNSTPNCIGQLTPAQIAQLDPQHIGVSAPLMSFINANYPHANDLAYSGADGVNLGGYRFNFPEPNYLYNYVGRVDYNLTSKQRLFGRFSIARQDSTQSANAFPGVGDGTTNPFQDRSYSYVVSHVWQIGNNKVNQFYYGDTIQKYNFPSLYDPTGTSTFALGGSTSNASNLFGPFNDPGSQKRRVPIPEVRDDFNWQVGAHSLSFGGLFKFIKTNSRLIGDFNNVTLGLGGESFSLDSSVRPTILNGYGNAAIRTAGTTSSAVYDAAFALALGRIASVGSNYNYNASGQTTPQGQGAIRAYRFFQSEMYAGDTWKVGKQLTLSYGVRYQLYSVPYETHGAQSVQNFTFDQYFNARRVQSAAGKSGPNALPFITYQLGGKANNAPALYDPSYKDFAPRFAFSYNPTSMSKTVFNGSFAMVYDRTVINAINFIQDQSSYLFQNSANTQYGGGGARAALGSSNPRIGAGSASSTIGTNLAYTNPNTPPTINRPLTPFVTDGVPFGLASSQFNEIVDPRLRTPYSLTMTAGVQQELPWHMVMKLSYAGRLGRRLLAAADASQLIDFADPASGQTMAQAFGTLTQQARNGQNFTPQPWFENQAGAGSTLRLAGGQSTLVANGDFADFIQSAQASGDLDYNVGMASQFAENTFLTNKGTSTYHGMLLTLSKNISSGLRFDFNYTWSHSMDNVSAPGNYIASSSGANFLCDATQRRSCYANSDFDITHVINSTVSYDLPFGRGRAIGATMPIWLQEVAGGWNVSAIPQWRSGMALNVVSNAYVAGYAENAPAFFHGNREDLKAHPAKDPSTGAVYLFGSAAKTAAVAAEFSGPVGLEVGSRNNLRGPSAFLMDAGLGKSFALLPNERLNLKFRADFFNVLNHPVFAGPDVDSGGSSSSTGTDITSGTFGQIRTVANGISTYGVNGQRIGQFSLRLEF